MSKFITCVQTGASRCRPRHEEYGSSMKGWRCDLTALSQLHNLYFVACNDTILVHQPEFPDQTLSEPKLILEPPVSGPNLRPYVDHDDPHSITRLLVDYLGNDEILLAACDDGDVIGYRIEEIQRALDLSQQSSDEEEDPDFAAHVRVFLHRNVGLSAWGLAVHREARIIAISANTHEITVLAFALASGGHASDEPGFLDAILDTDFPSPRRRDHIITLKAGHNVPTVSFNNSDEDPGGRWLFATCITGETTLWDLHNPQMPTRAFRMGWCSDAPLPSQAPPLTLGGCHCLGARNHPHATWDAMFLSPRSAHEVLPIEREWASADAEPFFDDAKIQKERFRSNDDTTWNVFGATNHGTTDDTSTDDELLILESASESSEAGSDSDDDAMSVIEEVVSTHNNAHYDNESDQPPDQNSDPDHEQQPQAYTGPALPSIQDHLETHLGMDQDSPQPTQPSYMPFAVTGVPQFPIAFEEIAHLLQDLNDVQSDVDADSLFMPPDLPDAIQRRLRPPVQPPAYCEIKTSPSFKGWDGHQPCLIVAKDDIFLLQSPFRKMNDEPKYTLDERRTTGFETDHTLVMRRPSYLGPWRPNPVSSDRLCFSTQIPELGIFIVASPSGHAAIFALTKSRDEKSGYSYGFQLEYILPFSKDDDSLVVEHVEQYDSDRRMVGVAVGPVQGMLGRESGSDRTWRLLMYFTDHTVMSFELKRKRVEGTPRLGDLIV